MFMGGNEMDETRELNNYEKTLLRAETEFLRFDQEEIIKASGLRADEDFIYVTFFYAPYRVDRRTGRVEAIAADGSVRHAEFSEGMSIFDAICEPTPFRSLSGDYVDIGYFAKMGSGGVNLSQQRYAAFFLEEQERYKEVCDALGARPYGRCDIGYEFDVFPFLSMVIQLWEGEEGIPPAIRFLWDRNARDFLRFETMMYANGHILRSLTKAIGGEKAEKTLENWV